jgi:molybdate-binding protein
MNKVKFTNTNFSLSVESWLQLESFILINRNSTGTRVTFENHTECVEFKRIVDNPVALLED